MFQEQYGISRHFYTRIIPVPRTAGITADQGRQKGIKKKKEEAFCESLPKGLYTFHHLQPQQPGPAWQQKGLLLLAPLILSPSLSLDTHSSLCLFLGLTLQS